MGDDADSHKLGLEPVVLFEDEHLLALAKPFGMPSQRDPSGDTALIDWAEAYLSKTAHLLHRLDRPTGGLVLLGKSPKATAWVSKQFAERRVQKVYLGVTKEELGTEPLTLKHHIGKLPGKNFVRAYDKAVRNSKPAELKLFARGRQDGLTLLEIHPLTGRRHQIRAQLRTLNSALLGERKYGKGGDLSHPGIALWAHQLSLKSLSGDTLNLSAPRPSFSPWAGWDKTKKRSR